MKNSNQTHLRAGLAGIATGLFSGYFMMGPWSSISLWAIMAIILGLGTEQPKDLWSSVTYGILLTFSFLLYGFGGTVDKLPAYLLFILILSIGGIAGSYVMMFLGNIIKKAIV
jgi:hypothetical protein